MEEVILLNQHRRGNVQWRLISRVDTVQGQASILSDEMIDAMHIDTTGGKANPQEGAGYGIGWVRNKPASCKRLLLIYVLQSCILQSCLDQPSLSARFS